MKNRSFALFEAAIKSPATKYVYTRSLHEFMEFVKITEYDDIVKLSTDKIQKLLENWVMDLASRNLKASTIRGKLCGIELLLEMNKKMYHKKILHRLIPSSDYVPGGEKPFTTKEIQQLLDSTTKLRTKTLVHFFASTGVRPASITDPVLRLKHIEDMPNGCKVIRIYDGSKEGYWAFLTPEASISLNQYLQSRKLNGEELTQESPVFAISNPSIHTTKNNYLSAKSVRHLMNNLIKTAGIERVKEGNRFDKATTYGFRKRFNTILKLNNDINSNVAEKLMAHKRGLDGTYLQPTKEECFIEFFKAVSQLTIDPTKRQQLIIENQEKSLSEYEIQQKQINELEKRFVGITSIIAESCADDETTKLYEDLIKEHIPKHKRENFKLEIKRNIFNN